MFTSYHRYRGRTNRWGGSRERELIPPRGAVLRHIPHRQHVVIPVSTRSSARPRGISFCLLPCHCRICAISLSTTGLCTPARCSWSEYSRTPVRFAGRSPARGGAPQAWHHVVIPAAAAVAVLRIINLTNIHDDPQTLQVVLKRQHPAVIAPAGSSSSKRSGLPVAALTRRWFFTVQPAALSRASALSKLARSKPSPRETGGW